MKRPRAGAVENTFLLNSARSIAQRSARRIYRLRSIIRFFARVARSAIGRRTAVAAARRHIVGALYSHNRMIARARFFREPRVHTAVCAGGKKQLKLM